MSPRRRMMSAPPNDVRAVCRDGRGRSDGGKDLVGASELGGEGSDGCYLGYDSKSRELRTLCLGRGKLSRCFRL